MIHLSRIHDAGSIVVNADLIETIEACPDTTITLLTKRKLVVKEPLETVIQLVVEYHQLVNQHASHEDASSVRADLIPPTELSARDAEAA